MGQRMHQVKLCTAFRDCFIGLWLTSHGDWGSTQSHRDILLSCLFFGIVVILIGVCHVVHIKGMGTYLYYGVSRFNYPIVLWLVATTVPWIVGWDVSPFFSCHIFCLASERSTTIVHLHSCCLASISVTYPGQPYPFLWWQGRPMGNSLNPPIFERQKPLISIAEYVTFMTTSSQIAMPHQWLEGNLPVSAKCAVCDKTCGSVLRLQDWKCLWCKAMVGAMNHLQMSRILPALLLTIIFMLSFHNHAFGLSRGRQLVQT